MRSRYIKPQWQWTRQSRTARHQDVVSVLVFKEDALHNHVELITFHHEGEVELGFMLEVVPTQNYRKRHGLVPSALSL